MPSAQPDDTNYRLFKRGDRFHIKWWEAGTWRRFSTGETDRSAAERALAQFVAGRGTAEPPVVPVISQIMAGYLADRKPDVRSFGTLEACAKAINRHLGNLEAPHLTKERVKFYGARRRAEGHVVGPANARRKKPTQDGTIARELRTLRAAFKWAAGAKWITQDEIPHIAIPRSPPPRDRWLSKDEAKSLVDAARAPHIRLFLILALYTAGRAGALLDLTWDRVDLAARLIDFESVDGGKRRVPVPIAEPLLVALREARDVATSPYVIEHGGSQVASVKTGTRAAALRAKLPGVTPHILRHTAATWMARRGVPIDQISRFLGHSDPAVTYRVYAKYGPDYLRSAMDALTAD